MPILFNPNKKKGVFMIPTGGTQAISCAFSYSASSYTDADPDPTPTVTGTSGGTFTSTAGIVINADTGEIDLSASTLNTYVVTYTVGAKACTQSVEITASFSNTKSLAFDGIDDYISLSNSLNLGTVSTISAWIKRNVTGAGTECIFGENSYAYDYLLTIDYNLPTAYVRFGGGYVAWDATPIDDTDWHSVIIVRDTETTAKIYFDGVDQGSPDSTSGTLSGDTLFQYIGNNYSSNSQYFEGNIDEVSAWNSDKSASVSAIYNSGTPNNLSSLSPIFWARMGDSSTFREPQILMPENTNIEKVSNYSMTFDGADDYIDCGEIPPLFEYFPIGTAKDTTWSASMWVKGSSAGAFFEIPYIQVNSLNARSFGFAFTGTYLYFGGKSTGIKIKESGATAFSTTDWNHIVMTFDGVDYTDVSSYTLYVGGVSIPIVWIPVNITDFRTENISIGVAGSDGSPIYWNGNIDEVSLFDTELSSGDVTAMYNSGTPTTITGAVGYWKLGEEAKFTDNWLVPNSALSNYSNFSFAFDGVDDYVNMDNPTDLQFTGDFTFSAWVKTTASGATNIIIGKDDNAPNRSYLFYMASTGELTLIIWRSTVAKTVTSTGTINDGNWHNVIGINDGTNLKLYIDGSIDGSVADGGAVDNTTSLFQIGARNFSPERFFNGTVDEVAVWNSDKTSDVTAIYNSGTPTTITGAVAHWRMGENASFNTNWTVPDSSTNSNTGTSANMTVRDLKGEAPNYSGGGVSNAMTIEDRVGEAPNSDNNSVSYNMTESDIETETP